MRPAAGGLQWRIGVHDEALDTDPGDDDARGQRQVPVDEQVVPFVGGRAAAFRVGVLGVVELLLAVLGGDVEVVPPQGRGDDETGDPDGDGGCGPANVVHPGRGAADRLPENQDD